MEITELLSYLTEFGSLAMFAAFLYHQYNKSNQKLDKLVDDFQKSLKDIETSHKEDEEKLRARYDKVIEQQRKDIEELREAQSSEKTQIRANLSVKLEEIHRTVFANMKKVDGNTDLLKEGLIVLQDVQLEKKARELAKKQGDT